MPKFIRYFLIKNHAKLLFLLTIHHHRTAGYHYRQRGRILVQHLFGFVAGELPRVLVRCANHEGMMRRLYLRHELPEGLAGEESPQAGYLVVFCHGQSM